MTEQDNPTTQKAGARHNAADMARLAHVYDKASEIQAAAVELGHLLPDPGVQTIKAGDVVGSAEMPVIFGVVKAAGDWELDVLANPFGGPDNGRDTDGEYFSPRTKFHIEQNPNPPAVYYHGYGDDKKPMGMPEFIGKTVGTPRVDAQGVWYRVVLNRASKFAARVWEAAKRGAAHASSGVVLATHRVDRATGEILSWLNGEISIFETDTGKRPANGYAVAIPALKAVYAQAGLVLPVIPDTQATPQTDTTGAASPVAVARRSAVAHPTTVKSYGVTKMTPEELQAAAEREVAAEQAAAEAAAAKEQEIYTAAYKAGLAKNAAAVKAAEKAVREAELKPGRMPLGGTPDEPAQAPAQAQFAYANKFANLAPEDKLFTAGLLYAQKSRNQAEPGPSGDLLNAIALDMAEDKTVVTRRNGQQINLGDQARSTLKGLGLDPQKVLNGTQKANELNHSTQASYGDEWIGVEYSRRLWEAIRFGTFVLDKMPSIEVPQGAESVIVPLESGDPTWYKVAQTTAEDSTDLRPVASVASSKLGTTSKTLTVAKMGTRVQFSGELVEDSLIPWAAQLRRQIELSGAQMLEHVIIDGDTDATNATNINDIDGTPGATELFLLMNGFRKSPLITTTANARSAGGTLLDTDFLETVKLMGTGGLNAIDREKVEFIVDVNTYWKALQLATVKTRDVNSAATIENGELARIWGYNVRRSGFMHYESAKRMAESTGKIDQTDSDNTTGAILAVRYDQWLFGYKRRFQIKLQEMIDSDSTQIVAFARVGMVQRDTEASAITYNVGL